MMFPYTNFNVDGGSYEQRHGMDVGTLSLKRQSQKVVCNWFSELYNP